MSWPRRSARKPVTPVIDPCSRWRFRAGVTAGGRRYLLLDRARDRPAAGRVLRQHHANGVLDDDFHYVREVRMLGHDTMAARYRRTQRLDVSSTRHVTEGNEVLQRLANRSLFRLALKSIP